MIERTPEEIAKPLQRYTPQLEIRKDDAACVVRFAPTDKEGVYMSADVDARLRELDAACKVLGDFAAAKLEGQKNHIRQAKHGTGVLKAWQQRCSKAQAAMLANPTAARYLAAARKDGSQ